MLCGTWQMALLLLLLLLSHLWDVHALALAVKLPPMVRAHEGATLHSSFRKWGKSVAGEGKEGQEGSLNGTKRMTGLG